MKTLAYASVLALVALAMAGNPQSARAAAIDNPYSGPSYAPCVHVQSQPALNEVVIETCGVPFDNKANLSKQWHALSKQGVFTTGDGKNHEVDSHSRIGSHAVDVHLSLKAPEASSAQCGAIPAWHVTASVDHRIVVDTVFGYDCGYEVIVGRVQVFPTSGRVFVVAQNLHDDSTHVAEGFFYRTGLPPLMDDHIRDQMKNNGSAILENQNGNYWAVPMGTKSDPYRP